jgi:hypothetical protein
MCPSRVLFRASRVFLASSFAAVAASIAFTGCQSSSDDAGLCVDIPDGGCPLANGLACTDPSCAAAYACQPGGNWVLDHVCPPNDAMISNPVPPPDAGYYDAPIGSQGCPELEYPDCSATTAASCAGCCGCEDLWVCQSDGTWASYGYCTDDGVLVVNDGG